MPRFIAKLFSIPVNATIFSILDLEVREASLLKETEGKSFSKVHYPSCKPLCEPLLFVTNEIESFFFFFLTLSTHLNATPFNQHPHNLLFHLLLYQVFPSSNRLYKNQQQHTSQNILDSQKSSCVNLHHTFLHHCHTRVFIVCHSQSNHALVSRETRGGWDTTPRSHGNVWLDNLYYLCNSTGLYRV